MSISELTDYFLRYGAFFIYLIVLLEYLNLPGFPAGVIMPLAGIWAAKGEISFPMVMVLTVFAGLTGSWALYLLGRFGGGKVMEFYFKKFPKHRLPELPLFLLVFPRTSVQTPLPDALILSILLPDALPRSALLLQMVCNCLSTLRFSCLFPLV